MGCFPLWLVPEDITLLILDPVILEVVRLDPVRLREGGVSCSSAVLSQTLVLGPHTPELRVLVFWKFEERVVEGGE